MKIHSAIFICVLSVAAFTIPSSFAAAAQVRTTEVQKVKPEAMENVKVNPTLQFAPVRKELQAFFCSLSSVDIGASGAVTVNYRCSTGNQIVGQYAVLDLQGDGTPDKCNGIDFVDLSENMKTGALAYFNNGIARMSKALDDVPAAMEIGSIGQVPLCNTFAHAGDNYELFLVGNMPLDAPHTFRIRQTSQGRSMDININAQSQHAALFSSDLLMLLVGNGCNILGSHVPE